ncbi:helix-turn-helix domain-containing protein [Actinomadura fulvescens]|uniref:Helix-turn-helix domain-containing protein n=1 Tax=Actinomadura fulvescens TaxID=46160 RepID=A0ABN3PU44_9ACTN
MAWFTIDTRKLPAPDRRACWERLISEAEFPVEVHDDAGGDFYVVARQLALDTVQISELIGYGIRVVRTEQLIQRRDPQVYQLYLTHTGSIRHTQCGRNVRVMPGEFVLRTSSRPYESLIASGSAVRVQFHRSALPLPRCAVDRLLAVPIGSGEAMGALLSRYLTLVTRHAGECGPPEQVIMSRTLLNMIAALCSRELDRVSDGSPQSHRLALLVRIHGFVEEHLDDPRLVPRTIADAHQISLRYLHKLFQDQGGPTVTAWIRRRRLERCRQDLVDPALSGRPINAIASRWGFTERAHFSKLFRATYGVPPGEYRHAGDALTHTQSARTDTDTLPGRAG